MILRVRVPHITSQIEHMHSHSIKYHSHCSLTFVDVWRQTADKHLAREALRHLGSQGLRRRTRRRAESDLWPIAESAANTDSAGLL